MSAETMTGFMEKLEADAGIRGEFETALGSTEDPGATVIEFANRHGFEVTEEDCRALAPVAKGEIDDDALETVSGGVTSDIATIIQFVLRDAYLENQADLEWHAEKVRHSNAQKRLLRSRIRRSRT